MNDRNNGKPLLEARYVIKNYKLGNRTIEVLKGIDFKVGSGEFVAVVGPSGAGKSTLLHILGTLEKPSEGIIKIEDTDTTNLDALHLSQLRRKSLGFVFQFHHLLPGFNALENVMMPALILGKSKAEATEPAEQLLQNLGLAERLYNKPAELSGGEQQRVAVARALMNNPAVILADEPTGNLDRVTGRKLEDDLVDFSRQQGAAVVVVTHNEEWAARADRVVTLIDGKISS